MFKLFHLHLLWSLLLLGSSQIFATNTNNAISGIVIDGDNQAPLAFVNIGILNSSQGTVSGPDGTFTLHFTPGEELTAATAIIRFSHLGYESYEINLEDFVSNENFSISLEADPVILETVQVSATQLTVDQLGSEKTDTKLNVSFSISKQPNQNLGSAVARKFRVKRNERSHLDSLAFFVRRNNFDTVLFRVNVHSIEERRPGAILHDREILVEVTDRRTGWVTVDLAPYQIQSTEDFIVSVEWIYHSEQGSLLQMPLAMPAVGVSHYYRYGSQDQWKKYAGMSSAMYLVVKRE